MKSKMICAHVSGADGRNRTGDLRITKVGRLNQLNLLTPLCFVSFVSHFKGLFELHSVAPNLSKLHLFA